MNEIIPTERTCPQLWMIVISFPIMNNFSLWLLPSGKDRNSLREMIRQLCAGTGTPEFQPHCTVLSGLKGDLERYRSLVHEFIWPGKSPLEIPVSGIGTSDNFWKSVTINFVLTRDLKNYQAELVRKFEKKSTYQFSPHLSLAYLNMPLSAKQAIAARIIVKSPIVFFELALVRTGPEISRWKIFAQKNIMEP